MSLLKVRQARIIHCGGSLCARENDDDDCACGCDPCLGRAAGLDDETAGSLYGQIDAARQKALREAAQLVHDIGDDYTRRGIALRRRRPLHRDRDTLLYKGSALVEAAAALRQRAAEVSP